MQHKKYAGTQLLQRINPDGEVYFTEQKQLKSFDRFPNDKGYLMLARNKKVMHPRKPGFPKEMKPKDVGLLVDLCGDYLSDQGLLMDKSLPIQKQQLPKIMQLHRNNVHTFLVRLESLAIIRLVNDFIYVNPLYLTTNAYLPAELYEIFQKELDPHLPDWVIDKYKQL